MIKWNDEIILFIFLLGVFFDFDCKFVNTFTYFISTIRKIQNSNNKLLHDQLQQTTSKQTKNIMKIKKHTMLKKNTEILLTIT
jgi:hypothetical protein